MDKTMNDNCDDVPVTQKPVYGPMTVDEFDEACRELDEQIDGVDWDEIIATTQDDFLAGRFAFDSRDYATEEEAMAAFKQWLLNCAKEVLGEEAVAGFSLDDPR